MSVSKVNEGVYMIDTFALGQRQTVAVYLIKDKKNALIDCGYASSYKNVLEALSKLGVGPDEIHYIIPTHVHLDHAGATGHLTKHMKNARVVAHERAVPHLINPEKLVKSATMVFGEQIVREYGLPESVEKERTEQVGNELELSLGKRTLRLLYTPGHAPHQLSITLDEEKLTVTADSVGIVYPDVKTMIPTTPPPSFNPELLLKSVDSLAQFDARKLLVPHFGQRDDVKSVYETTKQKVTEWVEEVKKLRKDKMSTEEIVSYMQKKVKGEAGMSELPVYASVSVRTTVLGILNYLEEL